MTAWLDKVNQIISQRLASDPHYYDDPNITIQTPAPLTPETFESLRSLHQIYSAGATYNAAAYSRSSNSSYNASSYFFQPDPTWTRAGLRKVTVTFVVDDATGEVYEPVREPRR